MPWMRAGAVAAAIVVMLAGTISVQADAPGTDPFRRTWERVDKPVSDGAASRGWTWGPRAISPLLHEEYAESPDGRRIVQYFDKGRMEITQPDAGDSAWYVTSGLLVVELVSGRVQVGSTTFVDRQPAQIAVVGDPDAETGSGHDTGPTYAMVNSLRDQPPGAEGQVITTRVDRSGSLTEDAALAAYGVTAAEYVPQTGHRVAAPFWSHMTSTGTVYENGEYRDDVVFENPYYATGFPIAEAYWVNALVAGAPRDVLFQCFERRCLSYAPTNPAGWQVESGNVGRDYYTWRYGESPSSESTGIALNVAAVGLDQPVFVTDAGDGSGRLFVVEKRGTVRIVLDGDVLAEPFLDLSALVASVGLEDGMLGLAFHPRFADTGIFFVTYTPARGRWTLARYRVSEDPNRADAESAVVLLAVPEPGFRHFGGHYGGMLGFGPDGYLYVSVGDGGTRGDDELYDPDRHAQDLGTLMGKLLRIDVDTADPYGIPPDNPFVDTPGARPEVWAYGLRNPWRFAFDPLTGDLLVGDVGLVATEEIDRLPAGRGGLNFGWPELEGVTCTPIHPACEPSRFVGPIFVYDHRDGCAVIGGGVIRGHPDWPLDGSYLLGDYCSGTIWAIRPDGAGQWGVVMIRESTMRISSFGRDASGNLYLTDLGNGVLYRIAPQTP